MRSPLGQRLKQIRASRIQPVMAEAMGVAPRTYASYERDERIPDANALERLVEEGWNANWVLTGEGPERMEALAGYRVAEPSQPVKHETLTIALQLATEALEDRGRTLPPAKRAELVSLIYDLLEEGLPQAKVLDFAIRSAA